MIASLSIQDLAIIEQLQIDFSGGFNVITGETGAGKSILIRALHFLMGGKPSPETIRSGAASASVSGEFVVPCDHPVLISLANLGIPYDSDGAQATILVRRQLSQKGRSSAWINDVPVTSSPLREIGVQLVDVFGQHENQRLMDSANHLKYVDDFLLDKSALGEWQRCYATAQQLLRDLSQIVNSWSSHGKDQDYLAYRLDELKKFSPSAEDYERTLRLSKAAERTLSWKESLQRSLAQLEEQAEGISVAGRCKEAGRHIAAVVAKSGEGNETAELQALAETLAGVANQIDEVTYSLSKQLSQLDLGEEDCDSLQAREFGYQELMRKFSVKQVTELLAEMERMEEILSGLETMTERVSDALGRLETGIEQMQASAADLDASRLVASRRIQEEVQRELQELSMPGSRLEVAWEPIQRGIPALDLSAFGESIEARWRRLASLISQYSEQGGRRATMLLASNPGEAALPLARIASGGELSRILLAFKRALAADAETCVLVFDEIDTGISGRVADVVGNKLRHLADRFQVICISHLPQVAVYADSHFLVKKEGKANRTHATIVKLSAEESANEVARLLSGAEVSSPSLANAKNLIAKAQQRKRRPKASHDGLNVP